jgi:hypothetical protein
MENRCLWIQITRPDSLPEALALALAARDAFTACRLVYEDSAWWARAHWEEYRGLFAGVDAFPRVTTLRGLRDVARFGRELKARQRRLEALPIKPGDVLVSLAGIAGLANAIASAHPHVPKVLCVTLKRYVDVSRPPDFKRYRHTTSGWLQFRFLEPAAGLRRTYHLKPWRSPGGDGVRLRRPVSPLEEVYQRIVVLSNTGAELPAGASSSLIAAPFPHRSDLAELMPSAEPAAKRSVLFFGTPFLLVRNLPPDQYAALLNQCLDYLRAHYAPRCRLIYRPHPAEKGERERLRLDGFAFAEDSEVAELCFLRNAANIEAVFSVSSTVSRAASNFGLNAYCFWRCFPFAPQAAAYFETLMGRMPAEFDIRSLDAPPQEYARRAAEGPRFPSVLLRAIEQAADSMEKPFARAGRPHV